MVQSPGKFEIIINNQSSFYENVHYNGVKNELDTKNIELLKQTLNKEEKIECTLAKSVLNNI